MWGEFVMLGRVNMSLRHFCMRSVAAVFALASLGATQAFAYWPYSSYYYPYSAGYANPYSTAYAPYATGYSPYSVGYVPNTTPTYTTAYAPSYAAGYAPYSASYTPYAASYAPYAYSAGYAPYSAGYTPYVANQPVANGYYYPRWGWGMRRWSGYRPYSAGYRPYGLAYQPYSAGYIPYATNYAPVAAPTMVNYAPAPYAASYAPAVSYAPATTYATSYAPTLSPATMTTSAYYPAMQASATSSDLPVVMAPPTYVDRRPSASRAPAIDSYSPRRASPTFCPSDEEPRRLPAETGETQSRMVPAQERAFNTSNPRAIRDDRSSDTVYRHTSFRGGSRDADAKDEVEEVTWRSSR
jgi:hypothetical protein